MTRKQYNTISKWQNKTFKKATPFSCANHLEEEVMELIGTLQENKIDLMEIADCFLLLIGVCNKTGLTYTDIVNLIDTKMEINYKRQWGNVNEKGYVKHID